ncbi:MAG: SurA N-terminal domain-containing protein [Treponema sp.]|nr:SurA N-terminal domain-containing protein [Treponema sp.]
MASVGKKRPVEKGKSEMAKKFRSNPLLYVGTFIILVIVVVAFVFVTPAGMFLDGFGEDDGLTFGYYDRTPIAFSPGNFFAEEYEWRMRQMQMMAGGQPLSWWDEFQVWSAAFESAAIHQSILSAMQRAGFEPPERSVDREMARLPMFAENGRFSQALYRQLDESRRRSIWRRVREDLIKNRFLDDAHGLPTPSAEARFIGTMASTERSFEMAVFPSGSFSLAEVSAHAAQSPELFRNAVVTFMSILGDADDALRIISSINNGDISFAEAAALYSDPAFGFADREMRRAMAYDLREELLDDATLALALSLLPGDLAPVARSDGGWAIALGHGPAAQADLGDPWVREGIEAHMRNLPFETLEAMALERASAFDANARAYGVDVAFAMQPEATRRSFGPVPINYGGSGMFQDLGAQGVAELSGASSNEHFWRTAFSAELFQPSPSIVQGGNVIVLFPLEETEAGDGGIQSVADAYENYWILNMTGDLITQHVMDSPRLDRDRFWDTVSRIISPMDTMDFWQ